MKSTEPSISQESGGQEEEDLYGGISGWVEARKTCDHLGTLSDDLLHIPTLDSHCTRWLLFYN